VLEIEQVHSGDHTGSPMVADIELVADAEDPEKALAIGDFGIFGNSP